jgi:hypothetical protein
VIHVPFQFAAVFGAAALQTAAPVVNADTTERVFIRVNQVGYTPGAPKAAVVCALDTVQVSSFEVRDDRNARVFGPAAAQPGSAFGACASAFRLDFSALRTEGAYRVVATLAGRADAILSRPVRISRTAYTGAADTLLYYMRQQRSGYNPVFKQWVHTKDALIVDHPTRAGEFIDVTGGWADAGDYLQYVATSAHATYMMLLAYRDHPTAFADEYDAWGQRGANGTADVLDESRHGLAWLLKMFPGADSPDALRRATQRGPNGEPPDPLAVLVFNQLGDDRDHAFWDLPYTDTSDYGWGRGGFRPVYPCTGRPQGLYQNRNRADGLASTAGKYAAAFALAAQLYADREPEFARTLRQRAVAAYEVGLAHPGACQTAPARSPYFYEEDNWADDMELGAITLYGLTGETRYAQDSHRFAHMEPVTPWMGADTANHYQWFPWHNNGHYESHRLIPPARDSAASYYRRGLERVIARADNAFRYGIPFIWCSNNLAASFATQANMYRRMTGDSRFREYEQAAIDWLLGVNPWGVSMIVGYPGSGTTPQHPHSVVADRLGIWYQLGGLVDGPVYRSIYENLRGIRLHNPDEYAAFNHGRMVYHDDIGDYSTNEPIMDGTANLSYIFAALVTEAAAGP